MFKSLNSHESAQPKRQLPIAAAAMTGLVALASWKNDSSIVRVLSEVRPDSSWVQWAYRWPGSFFQASPFFGKTADTALSASATALAFGVTERREGVKSTLKLAAVSQFLGCAATRLASVGGLVSENHRSNLDVGSSAVTVAFGANYLTQRARERRSAPDALACKVLLGASALALGAAAVVDPSVTDVIGHATGFAYGVINGIREPIIEQAGAVNEPVALQVLDQQLVG